MVLRGDSLIVVISICPGRWVNDSTPTMKRMCPFRGDTSQFLPNVYGYIVFETTFLLSISFSFFILIEDFEKVFG